MTRLKKISRIQFAVLSLSLLSFILFFVQLFVTNLVNREGVEQIAELEKEIQQYKDEVERMEYDIATFSALQRVEERAKELGLEKRDSTEYIR